MENLQQMGIVTYTGRAETLHTKINKLLSDNFLYLKLKVYFTRLNICIIEIIL